MSGVRISLTQGHIAIISPEDYDRVNAYRWHVNINRGVPYARRAVYIDGHQKIITMHGFIMDPPNGMVIDHINHDTLDNRRENLRLATVSQNRANTRKLRWNTSGFIGVCERWGRWVARFNNRHIGLYDSAEDAARAYDTVVLRERGEFAVLNFPDDRVEIEPAFGKPYRNNTSGYTGVSFHRGRQQWAARLTVDGRRRTIGYFETPLEAAEAISATRG